MEPAKEGRKICQEGRKEGRKTCQESIAIVKSGQNKSLNKELCCMFQDLLNIIQCKSTGPESFSNVVCEIQLIINHNSKVSGYF